MSRRTLRVADLAREAESDLDETLVALWDAGLESVAAPRHEAESRGQDLAAAASPWFANPLDDEPDNLTQTTLWDPQDDDPVRSAEELAVHQVIDGRR